MEDLEGPYGFMRDVPNAILDAIIYALPKEKEGINVYKEGTPDEFYSCLECGGYDECDCEGFNECLEQIKQLLKESKEI